MSRSPHLLVVLSGHGFGHLAQTAPVLNALRRDLPALRLTIQCTLPATILHSQIEGDFQRIPEATDFGMIMANALDVLAIESLAAYQAFHAEWDTHLARQSTLLERLAPDLVLANIPYLPLAAAARLGIPAVALCSLNWTDILEGYCPNHPDLPRLRATMLDAYRSAQVFLRPAPSMPMPALANTCPIGPIAAIGRDRRVQINTRLGLDEGQTLVLIALGGIATCLPMEHWPVIPGLCWLVPAAWEVKRSDILCWEMMTDIPFVDLVRSCDVLLTKPGYGSFTEAACNSRPVVYVERGDWPEEPWLTAWLTEHGNAVRIDRERLETGDLQDALRAVLAQPRKAAIAPYGIDEAVVCLREYLAIP